MSSKRRNKKSSSVVEKDSKYLVIVESPTKCSKIEGFLGKDYKCIASMGHLRNIEGLQSIDIKNNFHITFTNIPNKSDHIEWMRSIISQYSYENIYIGTDDDREGMSIAWHICVLFNLPIEHTPRILFNEITKSALEAAVQNPTRVDMNMVHAQNARQILDMYVGFKISPYLWKYLYSSKSAPLSAGRCQTPALRIIYDNQKEIDAYIKTGIQTKYKVVASFFSRNLPFELDTDLETQEAVESFLHESQWYIHTLTIESPKESVLSAPKPFNTSRLLQTASNQLSLSPKQTMNYCQLLYQSGYITYMRTDATTYSNEFADKARKYITNTWGENYVGDLSEIVQNNTKAGAANPHEAIRTTQLLVSEVSVEEPKMAALYKLIWRNSIESCMSPAIIKKIDARISAPNDLHYTHTIEIPKFMGWKTVKNMTSKQADAEGNYLYLQSIKSPAIYNKIEATVKLSGKKPSHYTEASLIQKLEDVGIGRPSTFSHIIETVQERGYAKKTDISGDIVECIDYSIVKGNGNIVRTPQTRVFGKESGKLVIQPLGIETIEFLIRHFNPLFVYGYTRTMEEQLDRISMDATIVWHSICNDCVREIEALSKHVVVKKCVYPLENDHELCFLKTGPVIRVKSPTVGDKDEYEYKSLKKGIQLDLDRLRNGDYCIADLIEPSVRDLGEFDGKDVCLRNGRYGLFIEWGEQKFPCKDIPTIGTDIKIGDVSPEIVIDFLEKEKTPITAAIKNTTILRGIDSNLSIRSGKYGPYVFYQTETMKKPKFYSINKFKEPYQTCDPAKLKEWLRKTYDVSIE